MFREGLGSWSVLWGPWVLMTGLLRQASEPGGEMQGRSHQSMWLKRHQLQGHGTGPGALRLVIAEAGNFQSWGLRARVEKLTLINT